jgi:acetyltransferase-like isoleucine patch superfamily enzyme
MKHYLRVYINLFRACKKSDTSFFRVAFREILYGILYKKRFWLHQNVVLKGIKNIELAGKLNVGIDYVGFIHKTDKTYLNVNGKLRLNGDYSIGRGCRFDIGINGIVSIGKGGYIAANTTFIIMNKLTIGDNCAISWDCQFLDEDFHEINYLGKKNNEKSIVIGNNVWIGCGVKIYKGTIIPNNCVIASNSIIKGIFSLENSLIGGNPAKIIKENIEWK